MELAPVLPGIWGQPLVHGTLHSVPSPRRGPPVPTSWNSFYACACSTCNPDYGDTGSDAGSDIGLDIGSDAGLGAGSDIGLGIGSNTDSGADSDGSGNAAGNRLVSYSSRCWNISNSVFWSSASYAINLVAFVLTLAYPPSPFGCYYAENGTWFQSWKIISLRGLRAYEPRTPYLANMQRFGFVTNSRDVLSCISPHSRPCSTP